MNPASPLVKRQYLSTGPNNTPYDPDARSLSVGGIVGCVIAALIFAIGVPVLCCKVAGRHEKKKWARWERKQRRRDMEESVGIGYTLPEPEMGGGTFEIIRRPDPIPLPAPPVRNPPRRASEGWPKENTSALPNFMTMPLRSAGESSSSGAASFSTPGPSAVVLSPTSIAPSETAAPRYETAVAQGADPTNPGVLPPYQERS